MIIRILLLLLFSLLLGCTSKKAPATVSKSEPPVEYRNDSLGLQIFFGPESVWELSTSEENASPMFKAQFSKDNPNNKSLILIARQKSNRLFLQARCEDSTTISNLVGEEVTLDYYTRILSSSQGENTKTIALARSDDNNTLIWTYTLPFSGMNIIYKEYIFLGNGKFYRLVFWNEEKIFKSSTSLMQKQLSQISFGKDDKWTSPWHEIDKHSEPTTIDGIKIDLTQEEKKVTTLEPCDDPNKTLLWKIEGKNNTVYLFGSVHIGLPSFYPLADKVEQAFNSSPNLVFEVNTFDKKGQAESQKIMQQNFLPEGKNLKDAISPEVYEKYLSTMKDIGFPPQAFDKFEPWVVAITLSVMKLQSLGYSPNYGVEQYFFNKAGGSKKIHELETVKSQIEAISNIDGELLLAHTLISFATIDIDMKLLSQAWKCGNTAQMNQLVFKKTGLFNEQDIYDGLYFKRNVGMANKIIEYLNHSEDFFVVAGSAHFIGDQSIIDILAKKGYTVTKM